jgi:transposase
VRALAAELAARGILVSHYAVWHLLIREGITFKKKACAPASRNARRGAAASAMEEISGQA